LKGISEWAGIKICPVIDPGQKKRTRLFYITLVQVNCGVGPVEDTIGIVFP
jgi:hypothetical protein